MDAIRRAGSPPTLEKLKGALQESWRRATCWPPMQKDWTKERPEHGQCLVSSLAVSEYYGGWLVMAHVKVPGLAEPVLHFFNRSDDGDIDLTWAQFPEGSEKTELDLTDPDNARLFLNCLTNPDMHMRLSQLLTSVRAKLAMSPLLGTSPPPARG